MGAAGSIQGNPGSIPLEHFQELTKAYEAKKGEGEIDNQVMFEHLKGIYEGLAPAAAGLGAEGDAAATDSRVFVVRHLMAQWSRAHWFAHPW